MEGIRSIDHLHSWSLPFDYSYNDIASSCRESQIQSRVGTGRINKDVVNILSRSSSNNSSNWEGLLICRIGEGNFDSKGFIALRNEKSQRYIGIYVFVQRRRSIIEEGLHVNQSIINQLMLLDISLKNEVIIFRGLLALQLKRDSHLGNVHYITLPGTFLR